MIHLLHRIALNNISWMWLMQHHVVDARRAMFSSCSWHKKPTLVELETESSTVYCGEDSKTCPYDSPMIHSPSAGLPLDSLFAQKSFIICSAVCGAKIAKNYQMQHFFFKKVVGIENNSYLCTVTIK